MLSDKACRWCGRVFTPSVWNQAYCPDCLADPEVERERARLRKRKSRKERFKFLLRKFGNARRAERTAAEDEGPEEEAIEPDSTACRTRKVCPECGRTFRCRSNRQKYCRECRDEARRKARRKPPGTKKGGGPRTPPELKREKRCAVCGRIFAPASNRQEVCFRCRPGVRREKNREKVKRRRVKRGGKNVLQLPPK